jgi:cell division protein FtsB
MIKTDKIFQVAVIVISLFLALEITGVFQKEQPLGYSQKEVDLMIKIKNLDSQIKSLKNENQIIEKDNEKLQTEIPIDSAIIWNSHKQYRDSLREVLNPR